MFTFFNKTAAQLQAEREAHRTDNAAWQKEVRRQENCYANLQRSYTEYVRESSEINAKLRAENADLKETIKANQEKIAEITPRMTATEIPEGLGKDYQQVAQMTNLYGGRAFRAPMSLLEYRASFFHKALKISLEAVGMGLLTSEARLVAIYIHAALDHKGHFAFSYGRAPYEAPPRIEARPFKATPEGAILRIPLDTRMLGYVNEGLDANCQNKKDELECLAEHAGKLAEKLVAFHLNETQKRLIKANS